MSSSHLNHKSFNHKDPVSRRLPVFHLENCMRLHRVIMRCMHCFQCLCQLDFPVGCISRDDEMHACIRVCSFQGMKQSGANRHSATPRSTHHSHSVMCSFTKFEHGKEFLSSYAGRHGTVSVGEEPRRDEG